MVLLEYLALRGSAKTRLKWKCYTAAAARVRARELKTSSFWKLGTESERGLAQVKQVWSPRFPQRFALKFRLLSSIIYQTDPIHSNSTTYSTFTPTCDSFNPS